MNSDEYWIEQIKIGNNQAILELFDCISNYHIRDGLDYHLAQDISQDALLRAIDNIDKFRYESKLTTWAIRISKNILVDYYRKMTRIDDLEEIQTTYNEDWSYIDLLNSIFDLVKSGIINELHWSVFKMSVIQELPAQYVADENGITANNVYKIIYDTKLKIRNNL